MSLHLIDSTSLSWTSSSLLIPTTRSTKVLTEPKNSSDAPSLLIESAKRSSRSPSKGLQKQPKKDLSRILRTEAAIKAIERKANSTKYNQLWPKAVLEALDDAIRDKRWESALKIFGLLRKQHWYEPRCRTYTKLLVMLSKCKQPKQASLLFEIMRSDGLQPTIDVYTALVSVYGFSGLLDEAFHTLDDMKSVSDCKPDLYTYSILIKCCTKLQRFDLIENILVEMSYVGIVCSTVTYNTIIGGYGAYGNYGKMKEMEKWFDKFQLMGIRPDIMTFNILIRSYGKAGKYEKMDSVMEFMRKRFYSPTVVTFNIVIGTFGTAGNIEKMEEFFLKMKHQGIKPNSVTYCSLVSAYGKTGFLKKVDSIMRQIENSDVVLDTLFFNCIISAYGLAGDIKNMGKLFLTMKERNCKPDNITFATMIQAYTAQGMVEAAEDLEKKMFIVENNSAGVMLIGD
ncbi:pentatricopeptide repeat-containing protein At3g53170 isoform X3 [Diospyros lotus]|uniref:pentatricopeptide repeat-containing protein At3g53170 isoform X3 n=1 Tax=Diospyros lotus TaxID=55363 RepID=UPI00225B20CA|nr:pentatricopeptide repeat-containing protein At3g53170 isoform X3 [Diospyros lotus]